MAKASPKPAQRTRRKRLPKPRTPWQGEHDRRIKADLEQAARWAARLLSGEISLDGLAKETGLHHRTLLSRMRTFYALDPKLAAENRETVAGILNDLFVANLFRFHHRIHNPLSMSLFDKEGNETVVADLEDHAIAVRGFTGVGEFLRKLHFLGGETTKIEGPVKEREPLLLEEVAVLSKLSPELEASLKSAMVTSVKTVRKKP